MEKFDRGNTLKGQLTSCEIYLHPTTYTSANCSCEKYTGMNKSTVLPRVRDRALPTFPSRHFRPGVEMRRTFNRNHAASTKTTRLSRLLRR